MKTYVSEEKLHVCAVIDYTDMQFFAIEYLRENVKVSKTVFACSCGDLGQIF